ncbi:MAG: ribosome recycling factor [Patescibacteria group bacterium]
MSIIDNNLTKFVKAVDHFKQDMATLKTGRANPAFLDGVLVEAYGAKTPLNQLSSIAVPEARSILIQPWDKSILKDIEKGIVEADLGVNPVNEGDKIRIVFPQMTEESRKEIVKLLNQKAEQARIAVRILRDEAKEEILAAEQNKEFGEDERYSLMEKLDQAVGDYNGQIKAAADAKENEIMTI